MSTDNTKKELTAVNSKVEQHKLIGKHIGTMWGGLAQSSIEHFIQSGKVSGSFLIALENMMQEYASQQSDCLIDKNRLLLLNLSDILERNESMAEELDRAKEKMNRMIEIVQDKHDFFDTRDAHHMQTWSALNNILHQFSKINTYNNESNNNGREE